jgi:asparagine synthetase B (glutamine-hydrolysing)
MCGIAGIISASRLDERDVRRLIDPIAHRVPDESAGFRPAPKRNVPP